MNDKQLQWQVRIIVTQKFQMKISENHVFSRLLTFAPIITEESMRRTIPVAFIYINLLILQICDVIICKTRKFILVFRRIHLFCHRPDDHV